MSVIARQSTVRTVMVGPVLDADGVAVTDGVVADLKMSKNGGAPAALDGSATLTHRHTGHYSLALTANDLDTVGQAEVVIDDTVNVMPMKVVTVVEESIYDKLFAASAVLNDLSAAAVNAEVDTAISDAALATAANLATVQTSVDDIPTNAELATAVDAALDAVIADSIPADGSRPSVRQALYVLTQFMLERSVSSTTVTVNKPDGTTPLLTLTINDDTSPTSITRAT
jgi:hypothetical protein